jgi:hypothetical protein
MGRAIFFIYCLTYSFAKLALNPVRDHLVRSDIKAHVLTTEELHQGWFGVNPSQMDDEFWDGAQVTIRKIDKIDDDTDYKESGQVRFYAKWGTTNSDYYGIEPYKLDSLAPNNLVNSGVNAKSGEGVYGSTSTIPDDAEFYMEGVRAGKITLEWRYQKDSVDIKYEQTFLVATQQTKDEWQKDLEYKIHLDTHNDPSGFQRVRLRPGAIYTYKENMERLSECYDYYRECYEASPEVFIWPGMARLAGSQVVGGLSDAEYGRLAIIAGDAAAFPWYRWLTKTENPLATEVETLQLALFGGGYDIFSDIAWAFHAYRSSGYYAVEHALMGSTDESETVILGAFLDIGEGDLSGDASLLKAAAKEITRVEQNTIVVPTWIKIRQTFLTLGDDVFSALAENSATPNGVDFDDIFTVTADLLPPYPILPPLTKPYGNLSVTADRWTWITYPSEGVFDAFWYGDANVYKNLREDAARFDLAPIGFAVQVWDHEDVN